MGGELTALWFVFSMMDMGLNYCGAGGGCVAPNPRDPYNGFSAGAVYFQGDRISEELYYRRMTEEAYGPFHLSYGASVTSDGDVWAGIGFADEIEWDMGNGQGFVQVSFMPGLYLQGDGPDLGGPILARAGIEFGYEADNGVRFAIGVDHRSHGGIYDENPGLETIHFRVSIPLG